MTRSKTQGPTLRSRRRASGRVVCHATFNGCFLSFGDKDDPQTKIRFAQAKLAWETAGRRLTADVRAAAGIRPVDDDDSITVRQLAAEFEAFLDSTGRYVKHGEPTSHREAIGKALKELSETCGDLSVANCNDAVIHRHRDGLEKNSKLTRVGINRKIGLCLVAFRWGWKRGLVPKAVWSDLRTIEPLSRVEAGSRRAGCPKRIPTVDEVRRTIQRCGRQVGAMLRIQLWTGMRPGEVCAMRFEDVETVALDGVVYGTYRVREAKTSHHGHSTSYVLNAAALALLNEFRRPGGGVVFRPRDAMHESSVQRRAARRTKITKQTRERDAAPGREFGECYSSMNYRQSVERACEQAGVDRFVPHALRHVHASWCANHAGLGAGAAAAALNHVNRATTERYLHVDESLRYRVASLAASELAV